MTTGYTTPTEVANRALQMCGAARITSLTADDRNADEIEACYDVLRVTELRRNLWGFAVRTAVLRPISTTTMLLVPPAYDAADTYVPGAIVSSAGVVWIATDNVVLARTPADYPDLWAPYFGTLTAELWSDDIKYHAGDVVYTPAVNSTVKVYLSLQGGNDDDPTDVDDWDATVTYNKGDTVTYLATVYQSTLDLNINNTPGVAGWETIPATQEQRRQGRKWLRVNVTLKSLVIPFPIGTGPVDQASTRSLYRLPANYLRDAPQAPKQGSFSPLGAPSAAQYLDFVREGDYLVSSSVYPIVYRFGADIVRVADMDPMFCSGFACRIALEVCETLTQSTSKLQTIGALYKQFMGEARIVNAIEQGPTESPEDDFIACRR